MNILKKFFVNSTQTAERKTKMVYVVYRLIAVGMLISQISMQRWGNVLLLGLTLVLFSAPYWIERKLKIELPNVLEVILISFVFSSTILGELSDFYGYFSAWDTALHAINGFLAGGVGFSLVYLMNKNIVGLNLTPLFISIMTFCFSMTVGVMWEFFEYSADQWLDFDMQKDRIVQEIHTVELGGGQNAVYHIEDIQRTVVESTDASGNTVETVIEGGYLDIGLIDTMKDLFVNLVGAVVFSVFGYLYVENDREKYTFLRNFIPKKKTK